ncbi:MAG: AAA-like domain-containing protein [Nostocaceae cyanobacterium]|nr:AAA-like domain-containing protein [Nostocaceae cyanobacterium]
MLKKYYQVGGTLNPDVPSYIERQADTDLYQGIKNGQFCYVFNSRQMGKSSLQVRVSQKLRKEGFRCVYISLEGFGTKGVTIEQWYFSFIQNVADKCGLDTQGLSSWWREQKLQSPVDRFRDFIERKLLTEVTENIVIFIDEIDTVLSLDFSTDDFFALIRYCYNQRTNNPKYNRITFALLGVATPPQLIEDRKRTPFNIGEAIQLNPFSFEQARPLTQGLQSKVSDSKTAEYILREVLKWTSGQPFLTQKICEIIVDSKEAIPVEERAISDSVRQIVKSKIIDNWEEQDNPQHLRTIRDRIINSQQPTFQLLKLYLELLQQPELKTDDNLVQKELILSGLAIIDNKKIKIYNPIYQSVFDEKWVSEIFKDRKPYEEELLGWKTDKKQSWLLQGKKLRQALAWKTDKILSDEDYQFLNASLELERQNYRKNFNISLISTSLLGIIIGLFLGLSFKYIQAIYQPYILEPEKFSEGEENFFRFNNNFYYTEAVQSFKKRDYKTASFFFETAREVDKNEPELLIYHNNALARQRYKDKNIKYLTLAVAVPINARREVAKEILRGVAQAQDNFNKNREDNLNLPLLNIVIADDNGNKDQTRRIAEEFVKDKRVLGVIGHNTSELSRFALKVYDKAGLAMISATSTSTKLSWDKSKKKVFFRTIPSDAVAGKTLAEYAIKQNIKRVVIFSTDGDIYSDSLKEAFKTAFIKKGGTEPKVVNLADNKNAKFSTIFDYNADAAAFFPGMEHIPVVINIAREKEKTDQAYSQNLKLLLMGGDNLYGGDNLRRGKKSLEGLVIPIPWFAQEPNSKQFATHSCKIWEGGINWLTAGAYDATQAFIEAIEMEESKNPSRETVLKNLSNIDLPASKTSGHRLKFNQGEPADRKSVLVQVTEGSGTECNGGVGGFHYQLVQENNPSSKQLQVPPSP